MLISFVILIATYLKEEIALCMIHIIVITKHVRTFYLNHFFFQIFKKFLGRQIQQGKYRLVCLPYSSVFFLIQFLYYTK